MIIKYNDNGSKVKKLNHTIIYHDCLAQFYFNNFVRVIECVESRVNNIYYYYYCYLFYYIFCIILL